MRQRARPDTLVTVAAVPLTLCQCGDPGSRCAMPAGYAGWVGEPSGKACGRKQLLVVLKRARTACELRTRIAQVTLGGSGSPFSAGSRSRRRIPVAGAGGPTISGITPPRSLCPSPPPPAQQCPAGAQTAPATFTSNGEPSSHTGDTEKRSVTVTRARHPGQRAKDGNGESPGTVQEKSISLSDESL